MNYYRYKLIAPTGRLQSGVVNLPYENIMSAITHLERDGSVTLFVKPMGYLLSFFFKIATFRLRRRIKRPVLAEMLNNIAVMLRSGLALISALQEAAASAEIPEVQADVTDMITHIQGGMSFFRCSRKISAYFSEHRDPSDPHGGRDRSAGQNAGRCGRPP
jgi:type II secretory pathway component PulF